MKIKIFSLLLLVLLNASSFAQKNNIYKSVEIDTVKIISEAEFVKIANNFYQDYYSSSYGEEKFFIDQQFKKLHAEENIKLKIAKGLSSTAVFLTATGESQIIPLVFSAKAAALFPQDTIIVNNFGAILRMLDSIKTSLKILLYAKSLCPNAPVILTNLGNSLFELYDDKSAEYFFLKALKVNPDYALAHHGLVSVYLKRKDLKKAIQELFKGAAGIYSETLKDVQDNVKYQDSYEPPSDPPGQIPEDQMENQSSDNKSSGDRQGNLPTDKLKLPEFPNWSEEAAFTNDQSISRFKKEIKRLNSEATDKLFTEADALKKMNKEQLQNWHENKMKSGKVLNDKNKFMMDMLGEYYKDQFDKVNKNYIKDDKINSEKFDKTLQQISSSFEKRAEQIKAKYEGNPAGGFSSIPEYADLLVERCKQIMNLIKDNFADWKKIAADRHNKYNNLLNTYWVYCEQYLNQTYDLNEFEILNNSRKLFVYSTYSILAEDYSIRQLTFTMMNASAFASAEGDCPQSPPKLDGSQKEMKINVPKKEGPPCPFKDSKFKLGLGPCSAGLDCENIEAECGEGVISAVKWNYKKKEMTLFVGVGVKASLGFVHGKGEGIKELNKGLGGEAGIKGGYQITLNKQGQVIDHGFSGKLGAKLKIGGLSAGGTYGVTATAETGINGKFTKEFTATVFK